MNHKKYRVIILATALIIIGMRGLCAAQFSQSASIQKSDTWESNDIQPTIPINKSTCTLRLGRNVSRQGEHIHAGFTFRVRKYVYVSPAYQYLGIQLVAGRKSYESRLSLAKTRSLIHAHHTK